MIKYEPWATPKSPIHLVKSLIRSRLTYGIEAFFTASQSDLDLLGQIERKALKSALNLPPCAKTDLLYQEIGWMSLEFTARMQCAKFEAKSHSSSTCVSDVLLEGFAPKEKRKLPPKNQQKEKTINKTANGNDKTDQKKRKTLETATQPLTDITKPVWQRLSLGTCSTILAQENRNDGTAPWTLNSPSIDHDYANYASKADNPALITSLTKEKIDEISNYMQIYTDGSITNDRTGCAFVIPQQNHKARFSLNNGISIFTAELFAILQAALFVNSMKNPPKNAAIISDSKSALQSLARKQTKNRNRLINQILSTTHDIKERGTNILLLWTPSHFGIKGNEMADTEAKLAALEAEQLTKEGKAINLKLSLQELKSKIRSAVIDDWNIYLSDKCHQRKENDEHPSIFFEEIKSHIPNLPRENTRIILRIRTRCPKYRFQKKICKCKKEASSTHLIEGCPALQETFKPVWDLRDKHNLKRDDFIKPHKDFGDTPMLVFTDSIIASGLRDWF